MTPLTLSKAYKLAGFKGRGEVSELAEIPIRTMQDDFANRHRPIMDRPRVIYSYMRKAMDKKHMIERAAMEAAILKMKEVEKC